jgi:hypothetical protein
LEGRFVGKGYCETMVIEGAPSTVVVLAPATRGVGLDVMVDSGGLMKSVEVGTQA